MRTILVIDDDPQITDMMLLALTSETCCVQTVHSGRDALKLLRVNHFDLVITDIIMPELDGFEVIMAINSMKSRPRVIAMTGGSLRLGSEYLASVACALDVACVLHKPFTVTALRNLVESVGSRSMSKMSCDDQH